MNKIKRVLLKVKHRISYHLYHPMKLRYDIWIKYPYVHKKLVKKIRKRGHANVVFVVSNLAMWRYQGIYELLKNDPHFDLYILICPFQVYTKEQSSNNVKDLKAYFDAHSMSYVDTTVWLDKDFDIRETLQPDIMFYTQPYDTLFGNMLDCEHYRDKLLCWCPYGSITILFKELCNNFYQNIAWKLFYDTQTTKIDTGKLMYNRGRNIVVVGNSSADLFLNVSHSDVWKPQFHRKKRVIWAPHFNIWEDELFKRGSFLWLWDFMLEITEKYSDEIQFAFKPHPRLRTELYKYPGWGKERTDAYYDQWANRNNCQFEDGSFADLFMTSDAMIHDSGSFTVEYLFSQNPVMFTCHNIDEATEGMKTLGLKAFNAHYIGKCKEDVIAFLENTVLGNDDKKVGERKDFFDKYLLQQNGKTPSENVYSEIVSCLGF